MSKNEFDEMVEAALATLPDAFESAVEEMSIEVIDRPSPQDLGRLGDRVHGLLLGLYTGVPRTKRTIEATGQMPDRVQLFRENIERVCGSREALAEQVRVTLLHEIGHHFGMDEDDLKKLGYG